MNKTRVIIIGGGAAGFFAAINLAEFNSDLEITILERSAQVLQKVKISGGGRCNVTHACFDPKELTEYYPRGKKELLGPFHTFMTGDVMAWFEERGVPLKIEEDGRVFPESNSSQSILDCFEKLRRKHRIKVRTHENVVQIDKTVSQFSIRTKTSHFKADKLLITTGGNTRIWDQIKKLGHQMTGPVPSLFTFNVKDKILEKLSGVSVAESKVLLDHFRLESLGPVLITHWGVSGPAILKLSSLGARELAAVNYQFSISINWMNRSYSEVLDFLHEQKKKYPKRTPINNCPYKELPKRLWSSLVKSCQIEPNQNWSDLSSKQFNRLTKQLTASQFKSQGKTTFKEEFVTAGGVDLKEINFKRFESKLIPGLFFAGEVLNIDGLTGGFNFQNAWTGGYIAARAIAWGDRA